MNRTAPRVLEAYLLRGSVPSRGCLHSHRPCSGAVRGITARSLSLGVQSSDTTDSAAPFRKQLKDEARKRKSEAARIPKKLNSEHLEQWELTVGIEIHAQLNTARKLFSRAAASINDEANTHVAFFDLAVPGSQPIFQPATLIPALRAALALNCDVQKTSRFDRKHYFHWDQPAGYQITQYYQPFARDGYITLYAHDGIAAEDGEEVRIGIKQVQMEQDTAKTIAQPGDTHLLDFNRAGMPLIEIISLPQIHSPSTAAAFVRKVQILLNAVDACVLGMESGGLRADVNVSVRRRDDGGTGHQYGGVTGLGQRTEIKNLSSFKAVRDAIIAERDRQINVLEAGGVIEGETRGWTLGNSETKRLRGKEGEVDYRYMPDPDVAPVIIGDDLVCHLRSTMGISPDQELEDLTSTYGLTITDALSLVSLNDRGRAEYFYDVVEEVKTLRSDFVESHHGRICGNWVLHELGGLAGEDSDGFVLTMDSDGNCVVPAVKMAQIINYLEDKKITTKTAKGLLQTIFSLESNGNGSEVADIIEKGNLWFNPMSGEEYEELALKILDEKVVEQILKGQVGKIMFLVGQMMRNGEEGRVEPQEAEKVIRRIVESHRVPSP